MSGLVIAEDLQSRYNVAKAQLDLCPPVGADVEDHWEGTRFNCEEIIELIERISRAEAALVSRNSMLDRLNASNERLTAENADMKAAMWRLCHEALDLYGGGSEQTVRMRIEMEMKISAAARAAKE